jgi:hypothetical protein
VCGPSACLPPSHGLSISSALYRAILRNVTHVSSVSKVVNMKVAKPRGPHNVIFQRKMLQYLPLILTDHQHAVHQLIFLPISLASVSSAVVIC